MGTFGRPSKSDAYSSRSQAKDVYLMIANRTTETRATAFNLTFNALITDWLQQQLPSGSDHHGLWLKIAATGSACHLVGIINLLAVHSSSDGSGSISWWGQHFDDLVTVAQ